LQDLDAQGHGGESAATIAALTMPALRPGAGVCLATPVHAVVGISRVYLHAAGVLRLDPEQSALFRAAFAQEFGSDNLRLHALRDGWLLEAPCAMVADADDPANLLGAPLERAVATTAEQRALRLLGAEIEMWLAGMALNRERERRGEPVINQLWFWGGGVVTLPSAQRWGELQGGEKMLALISAVAPDTGALQLEQLEADWFAPALRDLQSRRITALQLRFGGDAWQVRRRPWSGLWRRARPWWQVLQS
jgi:hypothetical protein